MLRQNQDLQLFVGERGGGWKMEANAGESSNDRRASGWGASLAADGGEAVGYRGAPARSRPRSLKYLLGSFKAEVKRAADRDSADIKPEDVGGLSVDETGLTVETISRDGRLDVDADRAESRRREEELCLAHAQPARLDGAELFLCQLLSRPRNAVARCEKRHGRG